MAILLMAHQARALVAPNGIRSDGIIINVATILAGAATNPFKATPWHHWWMSRHVQRFLVMELIRGIQVGKL